MLCWWNEWRRSLRSRKEWTCITDQGAVTSWGSDRVKTTSEQSAPWSCYFYSCWNGGGCEASSQRSDHRKRLESWSGTKGTTEGRPLKKHERNQTDYSNLVTIPRSAKNHRAKREPVTTKDTREASEASEAERSGAKRSEEKKDNLWFNILHNLLWRVHCIIILNIPSLVIIWKWKGYLYFLFSFVWTSANLLRFCFEIIFQLIT